MRNQMSIECSLRMCSFRNACARYTREHSGHLNFMEAAVVGSVGIVALTEMWAGGARKWAPNGFGWTNAGEVFGV